MPEDHDDCEKDQAMRLAAALRDRCAAEAIEAYEDAKLRGLCAEGAWEIAIAAIRNLDLAEAVRASRAS